jgi:hypothetical protein
VQPLAGQPWQDVSIVREPVARRRSPIALLALVGWALASSGCRERERRPPKVPFATQVAYGRPDTCPDDAVADVYGDGSPSPMDLRCSYADGTGAVLTRVRGRVLFEGPAGSVGGSPGRVTVVLHRAPRRPGEPVGPEIGHATTDPQGTFSLGVMLRPGEHVLRVDDPEGGPPLVQQRLVVGGDAGHRLEDVRLVIPRAMGEEGAEVEEPRAIGEPRAPALTPKPAPAPEPEPAPEPAPEPTP